tara:strand:- start:4196 stop:4363 length:168 start_codon:yes stop_codon:yes gene_type:complete
MFGLTKLTLEEKEERDIKIRIEKLNVFLKQETAKRQASLIVSEGLRDELESLLKK